MVESTQQGGSKQQQGGNGSTVNLGERIVNDMNSGWYFYTVEGHRPLKTLRDVQEELTNHGELIMRPDPGLIKTLDINNG